MWNLLLDLFLRILILHHLRIKNFHISLPLLGYVFCEMQGLACQHLHEELQKGDNLTLHSDGTSKYGQHFYNFQPQILHILLG